MLAIEFVGRSKRVLCGIVIEYFFVVGELLLTLLAWHFRQVFFWETDFGIRFILDTVPDPLFRQQIEG